MARGKARVVRDQDRLLQEIRPRPFVTSTSIRAIASMVTNANTAILNIIGIRGRTKVTRARKVDRPLREDRRLLVERRTETAMGWLKGDCQKGDKCTFKHDPSMKGKRAAPSTKTTDVKATPALVREYDDDFIVNAVPIEKKKQDGCQVQRLCGDYQVREA